MRKPEGDVTSLEIGRFQGIGEYVIKADLNLNVSNSDTFLFFTVNKDIGGDNYSSIEHIYGRFRGETIHLVTFRPGGIHGGLFVTRTHNHRKSNINIESKVFTSSVYPKIHLETTKPNLIISSHDDWILEDVSSIYNSPIPEIKSMTFYTIPVNKFYGYLEIYRVIKE